MNAIVDLLVILQSAPRVPTVKGPVMILDAQRTRDLDDAIANLDAPVDPGDGIQRGNSDLQQPGDIRQIWERR